MAGWTFAILFILGVLAFFGWKFYQGWMSQEPPAAAVEPFEVHEFRTDLLLPSSLPELKFSCPLTVKYIVKGEVRIGEDLRRVLEWEVHRTSQSVTSRYPLTVSAYLHMALNDALNAWRWVRDGAIGFQAECDPVKVEPQDLVLARELERAGFTLELESRLHESRMRNAERLGRLLAEPRTAALWWFAQHPDRVEDLPRITEMMFALDAQLNHRGAVLAPGVVAVGDFTSTSGADLDVFLADAGEDERTLMCNSLAFAYEQLGRPTMADRIRALVEPVETSSAGPVAQAGPVD